MYSDIKSVQILIASLKAYGIKKVVCSPGNRNVPIVHSLENDPFFETYSIVDERSAAFFGIGLIQHYRESVAICATSGTAVCNYYSAIVEAYYQKLPLLIISADRNPYYLNQDEEQMFPQIDAFKNVTKKNVQLPMIKDEMDAYVCRRNVQEAILELNHHGCGPVQINIPLEAKLAEFTTPELPTIPIIRRHLREDSWHDFANKLLESKVLVLYGQSAPISQECLEEIEAFANRYDAVLAIDPLANLHCSNTVSTFLLSRILDAEQFGEMLCPDIVITLNSGYMSYIRSHLKNFKGKYEHWTVNERGQVLDPFMSLREIFECAPIEFIRKMNMEEKRSKKNHGSFRQMWKKIVHKIECSDIIIPWSNLQAVRMLMSEIPQNAKLHLANSSSVRLAAHFPIKSSVEVYCNRGANGIDGSASAFIGMAYQQEELCYLLIGDLSFFYDMNSLWNHYLTPNLRIVMSNNGGATLFHYTVGVEKVPSLNQNIAAGHSAIAEGWVTSRGFDYISVRDEKEMRKALNIMADKSREKPVFVEVFTDKEDDAKILNNFYCDIREKTGLQKKNSLLKWIMRRK